jgi:hypothetical protein
MLRFDFSLVDPLSIFPRQEGAELTHSYVEAAVSTAERQKTLRERYHFVCECARCVAGAQTAKTSHSSRNSVRGLDLVLLEARLAPARLGGPANEDLAAALQYHQQADQAGLMGGRPQTERSMLEAALELRCKHLHVCHPLVQATLHGLFNVCLLQGDYMAAIQFGERVLAAFELVYQQFHPRIGLQHYTLGSLHATLARSQPKHTKKARRHLSKAAAVFDVCGGGLGEKVEALRLELLPVKR